MEPNKITLVRWVNQVLNYVLPKRNIEFRFKAKSIWLFNPKSMDNKIQPKEIQTTTNINYQGSENDHTTNEKVDHNQDWGEESTIVKLLYIIGTIQQIAIEDLPTNISKNDQHSYVHMS